MLCLSQQLYLSPFPADSGACSQPCCENVTAHSCYASHQHWLRQNLEDPFQLEVTQEEKGQRRQQGRHGIQRQQRWDNLLRTVHRSRDRQGHGMKHRSVLNDHTSQSWHWQKLHAYPLNVLRSSTPDHLSIHPTPWVDVYSICIHMLHLHAAQPSTPSSLSPDRCINSSAFRAI